MTVVGRNEPCPCGSGRKYKHCCLQKDEVARVERLARQEEALRQREAAGGSEPQGPGRTRMPVVAADVGGCDRLAEVGDILSFIADLRLCGEAEGGYEYPILPSVPFPCHMLYHDMTRVDGSVHPMLCRVTSLGRRSAWDGQCAQARIDLALGGAVLVGFGRGSRFKLAGGRVLAEGVVASSVVSREL